MKTIKFTDDELEFLRQLQQAELEETEKYLESLKGILGRIGLPRPITPGESIGVVPAYTGRKPRSDKGVKRGSRKKIELEIIPKAKQEKPAAKAKPAPKPSKPVIRKKKPGKFSKRTKGVFLTPLRKPLALKEPVEPPAEGPAGEKKE